MLYRVSTKHDVGDYLLQITTTSCPFKNRRIRNIQCNNNIQT